MLAYNELKIGTVFLYEGAPYEVIEYGFLRMQQRKPVAQTKIKNLATGKILERNFHSSESFEEAEIERQAVKYLYNNRGQFWFCDAKNPKDRFEMTEVQVGTGVQFLKSNTEVTALKFNEKIISIELPVKVDLIIKETPPGERGNTAQVGSKVAELETGAKISIPLFVNEGDIIRINTQTGLYVERVEKGK